MGSLSNILYSGKSKVKWFFNNNYYGQSLVSPIIKSFSYKF